MKALALISGGFDSAVAIKLMQNKLDIIALHFSLEPFTDNTPENKSLELARRLMYKVAEKFAKKLKCNFILDGCNLGQVSSQTLSNLANITNVVDIPVLHPLL